MSVKLRPVTLGPVDQEVSELIAAQKREEGYLVQVVERPGREGEYMVECKVPE